MIVKSNPVTGLTSADQAWFESDADGNDAAIREIDTEAAKYGLVRVREYWLQTLRQADGGIVRRGFCYRPAESDLADRMASRRADEAIGSSSADMVRHFRDSGK